MILIGGLTVHLYSSRLGGPNSCKQSNDVKLYCRKVVSHSEDNKKLLEITSMIVAATQL